MSFRIRGIDPAPFQYLFGRSDAELAQQGVRRMIVDAAPGFPDRIELRDGQPGEAMLLLNYAHQPAGTAFRASHAIFVREGATDAADLIDHVPDVMAIRPISLRAFDEADDMIDADLVDGADLAAAIERFLAMPQVAYLHAHYAKRGCFAARIDRA